MTTANRAMKKHVAVSRTVSSVPSIADGLKRVPTSSADVNVSLVNVKHLVVHALQPNENVIQIYARLAVHVVTLRNLQLPHNDVVMTILV